MWALTEEDRTILPKVKRKSAPFCAGKVSQLEDTLAVMNLKWAQSITLKEED